MRLRWYRWSVIIVGIESRHRSALPFIRFRHEHQAREWCRRMNEATNAHDDNPLTFYTPEPLA